MKNEPINRRTFAKGLALAPLGLAASSTVFGQVATNPPVPGTDPATPPKRIPKTAAQYNRHPPIHETDPFAETLTFSRHEAQPLVRPFSLHQVLLAPGPLQQARDWNRNYMMRLAA